MKHYDFADKLRILWDKACARYSQGLRDASAFFTAEEQSFLSANGLTAQNLYDYAEDFTGGGEPTWDNALAIELVRRDYFLNAQAGKASTVVLDETTLPAKTASIAGIEWLPRIIPKARAKLRGELPSSLMYCCGGDRRFFKTHDILPAEFLTLIWRHEHADSAVIDWVRRRIQGT
jgi:Domain of unknown function (DUF5069)